MLAEAPMGPHMVDVHILVPDFQHLHPLRVEVGGDLHGDQEVRPAELPNLRQHLRGGPASVLQGAAILVIPGVGRCAHIADGGDLHHIEAKATIFQRVVGDLLDPVLNFLRCGKALFAGTAEHAHTAHAPGGHAGAALGADAMLSGAVSAHAGRRTAGAAGTEGEATAGLGLREAQSVGNPPVTLHHAEAPVGVDPVDHADHIVVDKGVVHGEQRRVAPQVPVQLRQGGGGHGDDGGAVFGRVLNEADGTLGGVVLRALLLLGVALGHAEAGPDDDVADANGGQNLFVLVIHGNPPCLNEHSSCSKHHFTKPTAQLQPFYQGF